MGDLGGCFGILETVPARFDGEALLRARLASAFTHHQLARLVRIEAGERILGFERGAAEPTARIIVAIAEALGVKPMQLLLLPDGVDLEGSAGSRRGRARPRSRRRCMCRCAHT